MTAKSPNYAPRVFVDTTHLSREEWLAYRRQGIGGSDAASIMGISPFRTARDIYYDKLGLVTTAEYEGKVTYNPIQKASIMKKDMLRMQTLYPEAYRQFVTTSEYRTFRVSGVPKEQVA